MQWLRAVVEDHRVPEPLHELVLEEHWTQEELLEAVAVAALDGLAAMVDIAGDVPVDGSSESSRQLRAVA
jgi:phosphoribosylcarboxyaminoimidazole (NCAIR) mutase